MLYFRISYHGSNYTGAESYKSKEGARVSISVWLMNENVKPSNVIFINRDFNVYSVGFNWSLAILRFKLGVAIWDRLIVETIFIGKKHRFFKLIQNSESIPWIFLEKMYFHKTLFACFTQKYIEIIIFHIHRMIKSIIMVFFYFLQSVLYLK